MSPRSLGLRSFRIVMGNPAERERLTKRVIRGRSSGEDRPERVFETNWLGFMLVTNRLVLFCLGLACSQNPHPWTGGHVFFNAYTDAPAGVGYVQTPESVLRLQVLVKSCYASVVQGYNATFTHARVTIDINVDRRNRVWSM